MPFPDAASIAGGVTDCGLLVHYYGDAIRRRRSPTEQKEAINGHASTGTCEMWNRLVRRRREPDRRLRRDRRQGLQRRDAIPTVRAARSQDINVNVFGVDPDTGFARRPLDNVGIQYGLAALNAGVIDVDQFLDLNEHIGGYDIDGNIVAARAEMTRGNGRRRTYASAR